jgi:NosR/NirI family transcriptional regulator, nitrous oxide reductase regulator
MALLKRLSFICVLLVWAGAVQAESRFPQPQFESGYKQPVTETPIPSGATHAWVDVGLLAAALGLASWLALKRRTRPGLRLLMLASLLYFGFWRNGCICPVGSVQNVALALADSGYVVPATVVVFFVLPLVFTLLFGRTFCAAVCPLGAMQDAVIWRPMRLPRWLADLLGFGQVLYLGIALLFVAAGGFFMICRYDPFVGFFRLSGSPGMIVTGLVLLAIGTVVARPYCRFLCPYGLLLNWVSQLSWKHLTITPDECVDCRLCQQSCPFDAIRFPTAELRPARRRHEVGMLAVLLALLPVAVALGGVAGARLAPALASVHKTVRLAADMEATGGAGRPGSLEADAFRQGSRTPAQLREEAAQIGGRFRKAGIVFGAAMGAALIIKLLAVTLRSRRRDHEPERGTCFSCGRCFPYCPRDYLDEQSGPA